MTRCTNKTTLTPLRKSGVLAILLLAWPLAAMPWATEWSTKGEFALLFQSYSSSSFDEELFAPEAGADIRAEFTDNWSGSLRFGHREDLFSRYSSAALDCRRFGSGLEIDIDGRLERHAPGQLSSPLLYFDPDSLQSQVAKDADFGRSALGLRIAHPGDTWSSRLTCDLRALRYDAPRDYLSDQESLSLGFGINGFLPASLQADAEFSYLSERYEQRSANDGDELSLRGTLSLALRQGWELAALGRIGAREISDPDSISIYERPGGSDAAAGFRCERFAASADFSIELLAGRESWDAYDGYYNDGDTFELASYISHALSATSRMDLLVEFSRFDPDSLPQDDWTLRRGDERRWEADLFVNFRRGESLPLSFGLIYETLRMRGAVEDRFQLVQTEAEARWNPTARLGLRCALRLDRYGSRLGDDEEEVEWGVSGDFGVELARGDWSFSLDLHRRQHVSFLEETERIEDWESALRIRWHP